MTRVQLSEQLQRDICQVVETLGAVVLEIKVRGSLREPVIEIFVDNEQGVTIGLCQEVTQAILPLLESAALSGNYRVIVSSPGADRPLRFPWQYRKHIGRVVQLQLKTGQQQQGRIVEVDDQRITIRTTAGRSAVQTIDFADVEKGMIKVEF